MARRFKFRISRLVSCFQSTRSSKPTPPSNSKPHLSSLRRHMSSALVSFVCGLRPTPTLSLHDDADDHHYLWKKEDKWHVVHKVHDDDATSPTTPSRRKIYNSPASGVSAFDDEVLPPPPPKRRVKKKKTTTPRGRIRIRNRISTSSVDHSYDEEESEALVSSSRSFSTESTKVKQKKEKEKKERKWLWSPERVSAVVGWRVEGKVRESMAVVKRSEDPYEDFRRSMLEMIVEKQMFEEKELEQLLCCFLSLNSTRHHGLIVKAFTDIWEALFCF